MTFLDDCLCGRSQLFTFARRDFLQKAASVALPFLVPHTQSVDCFFAGRPLPRFKIGDLVAEDWLDDDDDEESTDFGEVLGVRWLPEKHSSFAANTWVYYVCWTHSTTGSTCCYPCYDGEPTEADRLRLVSHD
ncbi:hypothetical protein QUB70_19975 [Microcoleus sp. A003_D6]|uniref:hypothetical protein n=1 Tax=Microcoleus sp. A003_D6 TaxID=3055266 RepID=UPI002FCFD03B